MSKPKLLLIADVYNWAIHTICLSLTPYLKIDFEVIIRSASDLTNEDVAQADVVYYSFWYMHNWFPQVIDIIRPYVNKTVVGVHSHYWFEDKVLTMPETDVLPQQEHIDWLCSFPILLAISSRLQKLCSSFHSKSFVARNGVDTDIFSALPLRITNPNPLVVGWAGNPDNHPGKRGLGLIREAVHRCGNKVVFKPAIGNYMQDNMRSMPDYYSSIDLYICASRCEGASTPIREAMACGRPVISTRVGDSTDIIQDGVSGWLRDRSISAFENKIAQLSSNREIIVSAGQQASTQIRKKWSWNVIAPEWSSVFKLLV